MSLMMSAKFQSSQGVPEKKRSLDRFTNLPALHDKGRVGNETTKTAITSNTTTSELVKFRILSTAQTANVPQAHLSSSSSSTTTTPESSQATSEHPNHSDMNRQLMEFLERRCRDSEQDPTANFFDIRGWEVTTTSVSSSSGSINGPGSPSGEEVGPRMEGQSSDLADVLREKLAEHGVPMRYMPSYFYEYSKNENANDDKHDGLVGSDDDDDDYDGLFVSYWPEPVETTDDD